MEAQKSHAKLTRTQSSLLRSSTTIKSSIQSLSSINEDENPEEKDQEEKKKMKHKKNRNRTCSSRFGLVFVLSIFIISFFIFFYNKKDQIPTSENLLLLLTFIAVLLFIAHKYKGLIQQAVKTRFFSKCYDNKNKKPVQWFIGDSSVDSRTGNEGVEIYSSGDFYEGEFHNGKANGSGVYNFHVNGRYEGDWIDGKYDGFGIESWAKGSKYRGQYRNGLRHGFGVYKFYTGDCYAGEWFNGQSHGVGVQSCSDGSFYVGEFKCGVKHGLGCYHFRNGDRYAGDYFGDKVHGFGVYHFANGHCYEGSWYESRKQGYGMYTFRSGDTKCGEWNCNTLHVHLPRLTDAVLRAVEAARRTADNAINLRNIDEQVNRSAMAANRAATAARVASIKAVQNQMSGNLCNTI